MGTRGLIEVEFKHRKDHPHAYGDKFVCSGKFVSLIGSSPRVWGQAFAACEVANALRIIPTRVGTRRKTACSS